MHKVYGTKDNVEYVDREGAYLIPVRNNQVGIILWIDYDQLQGKMFAEMQNWALEQSLECALGK